MQERTSINKGEILADFISQHKYGDIIHRQSIEDTIGERHGTQRYYQAISKAKKILEERGKMIQSIGKGEYQLLYPGDYSGAYAREVRLANNRIKHGNNILNHAPVSDMTLSEKQIFDRVSDFHAALQAKLAGNTVEVRKLCEKNHPLQQLSGK